MTSFTIVIIVIIIIIIIITPNVSGVAFQFLDNGRGFFYLLLPPITIRYVTLLYAQKRLIHSWTGSFIFLHFFFLLPFFPYFLLFPLRCLFILIEFSRRAGRVQWFQKLASEARPRVP